MDRLVYLFLFVLRMNLCQGIIDWSAAQKHFLMPQKRSFVSSFRSLLFLLSLSVVGGALPPLNVGSIVTTC